MLNRLREALQNHNADFAEIRLEERESLSVSVTSGEVTTCRRVRTQGGIVRCLVGGAWGVSSFDGSDNLHERVRHATSAARAAAAVISKDNRAVMAPADAIEDAIEAQMEEDFRQVNLATKLDIVQSADQKLRDADSEIHRSITSYSDRMRKTWLVNSDGTAIYQERPLLDFRMTGYVKQDGLNLRAYEALSLPRGFEVCRDRDDMVAALSERTRELKGAIAPPAQALPVVMNHEMAGLFTHEAFGHLCEADNVHKDPDLRAIMTPGKRFGSEILTIGDDSSAPGLRATHAYDDEGTPTRKNYLLREGVLVGRMHSRETAGKMGEPLTGNGWAVNYRHTPIVRMTNTFIDPGKTRFDDMLSGIKEGLYACGHFGGSTTKEQFIFNASHGYMIRNGKLAEMVRNCTLTGNVFQTLNDIEAVGDDQQWHQMGYCGKAGQRGHPTSKGCPHIRIRELVIGGR